MQVIISLIIKEFKQIFRSKAMVGILFIIPIVQTFILGFATENEVKNIKIMIADLDRSTYSQELVRQLEHSDRFIVVAKAANPNEINQAISDWKVRIGLVIPAGFEKDIYRQQVPNIAVIMDGIDGNSTGIALGYLQQIIVSFAKSTPARVVPKVSSLQVDERMWYNLNMRGAQFMVPGIVVILVTAVSMMLSSMSLVREKEIGTLEQLMVTPINKWQLLTGKLLPFLFLSFVELFLALGIAQQIFSIHMEGSYVLLALCAFSYLFATLGLGILISTFTSSQQQAMFFSWFFLVFCIMLSGLFIPIDNMPYSIRQVTWLNPMRYFVTLMREIFQKGNTLTYLWKELAVMSAYGVGIFLVSVAKFHKKLN